MGRTYELATAAVRNLYDRRISAPPVLDPRRHFPVAGRFTANWQGIRDEALAVAGDLLAIPRFHELVPGQEEISANDDRDWRMFLVKAYGTTLRRNAARCPLLSSLLEECPEVLSANFSLLAPGKHIPCHRGPFRGVLRFHLGLRVPLDETGRVGTEMRVDGVEHRIGEGDSLLWDDTYPHEVWNRTGGLRVALLLDVRRPHLPWDLRMLSGAVVGAIGTAVRWQQEAGLAK